jgi:hypothetical protein
MAYCSLETCPGDRAFSVPVCFPEIHGAFGDRQAGGVTGRVSAREEETPVIMVDEVVPLESYRKNNGGGHKENPSNYQTQKLV